MNAIKMLWYWKNPLDWIRRRREPLYLPKKLFAYRYIKPIKLLK